MFFWGLVIGIVGGYIFKPQIDRLIQIVRDAINKDRKEEREDDKEESKDDSDKKKS